MAGKSALCRATRRRGVGVQYKTRIFLFFSVSLLNPSTPPVVDFDSPYRVISRNFREYLALFVSFTSINSSPSYDLRIVHHACAQQVSRFHGAGPHSHHTCSAVPRRSRLRIRPSRAPEFRSVLFFRVLRPVTYHILHSKVLPTRRLHLRVLQALRFAASISTLVVRSPRRIRQPFKRARTHKSDLTVHS